MLTIGLVISLAISSQDLFAQDAAKDSPTSVKEKVLKWIDDYRSKQVLFHDEDIARLREEVADKTEEEASEWWSKSAKIRETLESDEWADTRKWLKEFLKVQAIYSDKEIAEFRDEAKAAAKEDSPKAFNAILDDIERRRKNLRQGSADAAALRQHQLSVIQAFRQEEAQSRLAAEKKDNNPASFNSGAVQPVQPRAPRYSPRPLIDSLDAARFTVMRGFWGAW